MNERFTRTFRSLLLTGVILIAPASLVHAQEDPAPDPQADAPTDGEPSVTYHSVEIGGVPIEYTATAGYMVLPDYKGEPRANVFYVSYVKDNVEDAADRPVLFAFNGGPGSSSVWLHLGTIGPRRVDMGPEGAMPAPPGRLIDNPHSWLDLADLVFIDPVSTGYSRPAEGEDASQFHGLREDIESVGEFIRLWVTRNQRWLSPKFLSGESYGTTRAAGLSGYLQDTHGMYLNGIVFVSPVLNFQTIRFNPGNDDPYWQFLPTYTATAWYHNKLEGDLAGDLNEALRESEAFARGDYLLALARGDDLRAAEREQIATRLASLTGLSKRYVELSNLRLNIFDYTKELLRDQGLTVGRLDSRFTGLDRNLVSDGSEHDPSLTGITGPYTAALNAYVRGELGYENDLVYEILTGRVHPWSYRSSQNSYVNVAETLSRSMNRNPYLRVLFCSGYYDLATPYFAMEQTVNHLGLRAELRDNVETAYYESGHMMYIREADLEKLKQDVAGFVERSLTGERAPVPLRP